MSGVKAPANSDYENLALRYGGRVEYSDGRVFNSGGRTAPVMRKAPAPTPTPAAPDNTALITKLLEMLSRPQPTQEQVAPVVNVPPAQVVVQPQQRVLDWTFTFERDTSGAIKSIRAKAT